MPARAVLILGRDPGLLETRRLVLEAAEISSMTATSADEFLRLATQKPPSLLVLCSSLGFDGQEEALILDHSHGLEARALVIKAVAQVLELRAGDQLFHPSTAHSPLSQP